MYESVDLYKKITIAFTFHTNFSGRRETNHVKVMTETLVSTVRFCKKIFFILVILHVHNGYVTFLTIIYGLIFDFDKKHFSVCGVFINSVLGYHD